MAVEIKEMVIRVELEPDLPAPVSASREATSLPPQVLIEECVRRVLAILHKKRER